MAPGRTSCLVCSNHGGVQALVHRRTSKAIVTAGDAEHASPPKFAALSGENSWWNPRSPDFGVARSAVAGLVVAELVKLLGGAPCRTDLRNWVLGSGHITHSTTSAVDDVDTNFLPAWSAPDPPRAALSREFDPSYGDSVRAVPQGFTEWGVEEIVPFKDLSMIESSSSTTTTKSSSCNRRSGTGIEQRHRQNAASDSCTLRALASIVFARFGVEIKSVSAAEPGSECRGVGGLGGGAAVGWGITTMGRLLWGEWERDDIVAEHARGKGRAATVPKVRGCRSGIWLLLPWPRSSRLCKRVNKQPGEGRIQRHPETFYRRSGVQSQWHVRFGLAMAARGRDVAGQHLKTHPLPVRSSCGPFWDNGSMISRRKRPICMRGFCHTSSA